MTKIKFIYGRNKFEMIFEDQELIENIFEKYAKLLSLKRKDLFFYYKGKNMTLSKDKINILKKKNINILVLKKNPNKNKKIYELEYIICP